MEKTFEDLPKSEQEDFVHACKTYGHRPEDLKVTFWVKYPSDGQPGPIARQVRVANSLTETVWQYDGGNGTSWTMAFENDLKKHNFGRL